MRQSKQTGVGFVGFLIVMALLIGVAVLGMRLFPAVTEYRTIDKIVNRIFMEQRSAEPAQWRAAFDRFAQVDNVSSITGKDLIIEKGQGKASIGFSYDKKIALFGPASILLEFRGGTPDAMTSASAK